MSESRWDAGRAAEFDREEGVSAQRDEDLGAREHAPRCPYRGRGRCPLAECESGCGHVQEA